MGKGATGIAPDATHRPMISRSRAKPPDTHRIAAVFRGTHNSHDVTQEYDPTAVGATNRRTTLGRCGRQSPVQTGAVSRERSGYV